MGQLSWPLTPCSFFLHTPTCSSNFCERKATRALYQKLTRCNYPVLKFEAFETLETARSLSL